MAGEEQLARQRALAHVDQRLRQRERQAIGPGAFRALLRDRRGCRTLAAGELRSRADVQRHVLNSQRG